MTGDDIPLNGKFDVGLIFGLLHHLDDGACARVLSRMASCLREDGRLVTIDNCKVPNQSFFERSMLSLDRGQFVRTRDQYAALVRPHFTVVEPHLRKDLLRIPYHIIIMDASR